MKIVCNCPVFWMVKWSQMTLIFTSATMLNVRKKCYYISNCNRDCSTPRPLRVIARKVLSSSISWWSLEYFRASRSFTQCRLSLTAGAVWTQLGYHDLVDSSHLWLYSLLIESVLIDWHHVTCIWARTTLKFADFTTEEKYDRTCLAIQYSDPCPMFHNDIAYLIRLLSYEPKVVMWVFLYVFLTIHIRQPSFLIISSPTTHRCSRL
jgi:hypothetical protein